VWTGESATIEAQMDDIRAVMDEAGSDRAFVFGIESGAALCLTFAATNPHRTAGVIVHGALARGTRAPDYEALWTHDDFEAWYERIERGWGRPAFVRELFETLSPSLARD
jgi:pimeloyl-ACP methyl ester carboxylesterase